ncbi:hypothetical protein UlMin_018630 [Ulmus minor]
MAANSPEAARSDNPFNFRAPPPSPIASGRRSSFKNDDVLSEFLEHSLRVPDLILPDNIFPRQKFIESPPVIDFEALVSADYDAVSNIVDSVSSIGCFQLANDGISREAVRSVQAAAAGIFGVSPQKRVKATRSPEFPFGFEDVHGEESESELSEEFMWSKDEGLKLQMEGIWPFGYSSFCKQMESLLIEMDKVAEKILPIFVKNPERKYFHGNEITEHGTPCCLYKHNQNDVVSDAKLANSLKHEVIRMLIRRNDYSHALCLHVCDGSSEFHVYSKKGWVSFIPHKDALVVTIGDQIQAWSGGQYKHVIGKPMFKKQKEECISMAFLYSPPSMDASNSTSDFNTICKPQKTISFNQQFLLAIFLTLVYQFSVYIYKKF